MRKLYPDDLYDDLYEAGLIGNGKVIIKARIQRGVVSRSKDGANWEKESVLLMDQSETTETMIPILDVSTGMIVGDWTKGLTSEQKKRIHEEANVPFYYADHEKHGDTPIVVKHDMELDLSNPVHKAKFDILLPNDGIALSKEAMTENQDYYFLVPEQENKKRKEELEIKTIAVNLIKDLGEKGKMDILKILKYEKNEYIQESLSISDKLLLFAELAWTKPKDIVYAHSLKNKETRIAVHILVAHHVLVTPNQNLGPFYRPSTNTAQAYGELIGENIDEAIKNLGKIENADLIRTYEKIIAGTYKNADPLQKIVHSTELETSKIFEQVQNIADYELPSPVTEKWLKRAGKAGLVAYIKSKGEEATKETKNDVLRKKALELFNK